MYEHNALGYWSGLTLCLTKVRSSRARCPATALIILAGDIEMNPGPRFQCRTCKKYCKAAEKAVKCEDCEKRFHASSSRLV